MKVEGKEECWYVPAKFSAGEIERSDGVSLLSYRDRYGAWRQLAKFKALTGYSPGEQRDAARNFRKKVLNTVREFDNAPTEGFRVVKFDRDGAYGVSPGRAAPDVVLEDPRGFRFALPHAKFFKVMESAGWDMPEGRLGGKYVYANDGFNETTIVRAEGEFYEWLSKRSSDYYGVWDDRGVSAKDLKPGLVCIANRGLPKGPYMYAGKFDVFSPKYQEKAMAEGGYGFDWSKDDDWGYWYEDVRTGKSVMVFCRLDRDDTSQPYYARKTASKTFERAAASVPKAWTAPDGSPAKIENVLADMSESIVFNRFSAESLAAMRFVEATPEEFKRAFSENVPCWPFSPYFSSTAVKCASGAVYAPYLEHRSTFSKGETRVRRMEGGERPFFSSSSGEGVGSFLARETPLRPDLRFEDGRPVPGWALLRLYGKLLYSQMRG